MQRKATPDFDAVYREHADRVYRYCRALCGNDDAEAQDVAQETFIRAFRSLEQFEGRSSMLTWLLRIARREWIRRGSRAKEVFLLEEADLPDPAGDPAVRETHRIWLEQALARLPEQQREAVVLVKVDGLTHREAAEVLEIPQGTVQFHVSQGIRQLRRLLVDEVGVPGLTALLLVLSLQREMQAAVTAPPELGERIYASIGRAYPPAGSSLPASPGSTARDGSANWRHRSLAGVGGLLLLLLGLLAWKRNAAGPAKADPLQSVLRAMSQVKTAHATGTNKQWAMRGSTAIVAASVGVDYWYKLPASYRRTGQISATNRDDFIMTGGKAVRMMESGGKVREIPTSAATTELVLAPFSIFTSDGLITRAARRFRGQMTAVDAEWENQTVQLLTLEQQIDANVHRWLLYVDPATRQLQRVEYTMQRLRNGTLQPLQSTTLEHFEYNVAIPDDRFHIGVK